jgi:hypothetical protein
VDVRLREFAWTPTTERPQGLTRVTLRHTNGRQVIGEVVDQYEAICKAVISGDVIGKRSSGARLSQCPRGQPREVRLTFRACRPHNNFHVSTELTTCRAARSGGQS